MAHRTVRCGCGAEFAVPEIPPQLLHCPQCGKRMTFGSPEPGPARVREDVREPIRPLPPSRPWYPLVLLGASGAFVAAGLIAGIVYSGRLKRPLPEAASEGIRAKRRDPDPILSIREIPVLPPSPKSPPIAIDPAKAAPLLPPPPVDITGPLAKAQALSTRANLCGIVLTILSLTGKPEEAHEVEGELARVDEEIRAVLAPIAGRPEARALDYFKPGDQLEGFGVVARDPRHPLLFADAVRGWLAEAQGGAMAVATIERDGRTFTQSMWFPEFAPDLTRRIAPPPPGRNPK